MNPTFHIDHNTKGFASTVDGQRPVVIEYVDHAVGFYHVIDIETRKPYTIYRTSFMPSSTIPNKYRQSAFLRVAHMWADALAKYPTPATIDTFPFAAISVIRLVRNAREAKNTYGWIHPGINDKKWAELNDTLTVTEVDERTITIGLQSAKFPPKSEPIGAVQSTEPITQVEWHDVKELDSLCFLLERKLLHPRPNLVVSNLTDEIITSLESRYEVGFVQHETDKNKWSIV